MNVDDSFSSSDESSSFVANKSPPISIQSPIHVQPAAASSSSTQANSTDKKINIKKHNSGINPICNHRLASSSKENSNDSDEDDLFPLIDSTNPEQQTFRLKLFKNKKRDREEFWLLCKAYFSIIFLMTALTALFFLFFHHLILNSDGSILKTTNNRSSLENNSTKSKTNATIYEINLDNDNNYHLFWSPNYSDESILFELKIRLKTNFDWFAFGFSDHGLINNSDLCLIWTDKRRRLHFQDAKTDNDSMLTIKNHRSNSNFQYIKSKHNRRDKILYVSFRRYFDTCDPNDYHIDNGTTHLVYATGRGPLFRIDGLQLSAYEHGFQRAQLLKPPSVNHQTNKNSDEQIETLDFLVKNVTVPNVETTYWCTLAKLPEIFTKKIHIVQYEAVIDTDSKDLVHHMELFHCEVDSKEELPPWNGLCHDSNMPEPLQQCKRVTAAWAYGAAPMIYPENVGLPIGGANYSLYLMIEVHYNNPELKSGAIDNSGIRIYYTEHLREIDSGILEVGLEYTDKNSIPPNTVMDLHGYCVSECTRVGLPANGITIFASQLHTHLTGVSTWTEHIRGGHQLSDINRDNHYSPHFQEIRRLYDGGIRVYPGDALINVCRYDTRKRSRMTLGGFGITDEMCVNYIHYYPRMNLEVCKSSIDTDYLMQYFETMRINENQNTSINYTVAENYNNIQWTPYRIERLNQLYLSSPLSVQCNQSSGQRFPGYWNGIPLTTVIHRRNDDNQIKTFTNNSTKNQRCHWVLKKFQYKHIDDDDYDDDDKLIDIDDEYNYGEDDDNDADIDDDHGNIIIDNEKDPGIVDWHRRKKFVRRRKNKMHKIH